MSQSTVLLLSQPNAMSTAQLAAVSYLARYGGHTNDLYAYQVSGHPRGGAPPGM